MSLILPSSITSPLQNIHRPISFTLPSLTSPLQSIQTQLTSPLLLHPPVPHFSRPHHLCNRSPTGNTLPSLTSRPHQLQQIPTSPISLSGQQIRAPSHQLKNKWDACKKDWRIWTKLIAETGVGWSYELGTIVASDEWWNSKIQEIRGAKKFRQSGIEPSLKSKFDIMFSGVVATRQYAWAPSSGAVGANEFNLGTSNVGLEGANLEEGSGNSEENVNEDFENHNFRGVGGCICLLVATQRVVAKEKKRAPRAES